MFPSKKGDFYRFDIKTPMVDWSLKQITLKKRKTQVTFDENSPNPSFLLTTIWGSIPLSL